jgi:ABC-2 type transport system permease protein
MKGHRLRALVVKESRELIRDPITVALAVIMPLIMLFLFGYAVNLDVERVALGIYDLDNTPASRELSARFDSSRYFQLQQKATDLRDLDSALQGSRIKVGVVIPAGFARQLLREESAPVQVIVDGGYPVLARLASAYAEAVIGNFPAPRQAAIRVRARVWFNPSLRSVNFVVPGLFAVILMAFPPLLTALAIVREKETGTIEQIYASPVTSGEFIVGKLVPYGLVAFLEILMVIAVGFAWFQVPITGSPALLLVSAFVYVLTTVGIGLLVSSLVRTQLAAMLITLIVTLMPSFLFSGFLFPLFTMPLGLQLYSRLFPAGDFMEISRGVVLKSAGLEAVMPHLVMLIIYTVLIFIFAAWRMRQKVV